jgi:hypothetical protein
MELTGSATWPVKSRKGSGRAERERARYNGANGTSDMAGKAATVAVEPSESERDTMELVGLAIPQPRDCESSDEQVGQ